MNTTLSNELKAYKHHDNAFFLETNFMIILLVQFNIISNNNNNKKDEKIMLVYKPFSSL